jgi:predicted amidohydrolase YtcJ
LVFTDVEIEGRRGQTVVAVGGIVTFVGGGDEARGEVLRHGRDDTVVTVEGGGGALLPGLHDHHLHLFSLAARDGSVDCGRPAVLDRAGLGQALRTAAAGRPPGQWVRGYGYDESTTGALDAAGLDQLLGGLRGTPVRIQHRSGHQWVLNTAGVAVVRRVAAADRSPDPDGLMSPDGVFSDVDGALRPLWSAVQRPELGGAGARLARFGVTGVTDATVTNGVAEVELVAAEQRRGALGQRVHMLGNGLPARSGSMLCTGARKLVLIDTDLPSLEELTAAVVAAGARGVALHCVSRQSLVLAAVALREAGGGPHRIEHASVAPPEAMALLRGLPVTVVTQPGFISEHGDRYRREVEPSDRTWLYRLRAWTTVGVPLAGSTDAPFGDPDPWAAMRAAVSRRTAGGAVMGGAERLSEEQALGLFLAPLEDPGGPRRRVAVGTRADLCLLSVSWRDARHRLDHHQVRGTFVGGRAIWGDEAGDPPSTPLFDGSGAEAAG